MSIFLGANITLFFYKNEVYMNIEAENGKILINMLRIFPRLRRVRKIDIKKMNAFLQAKMAKCCLP